VRGEIAAWDPARDAPDRTALATALRPHLRLYLLGLLDSRMGRPAEALARATDLERLPPPQEGGAVVRALAATVRADAEWARGRAAAALGHLEGMQAEIPLELLGMPAYVTLREYGLEHAQYLRAAALAALGRNAEARRWLELGLRGAPNEIAFRAPAALLLADLAARAGDTAGVARHLDRVAALWAEADPPLRARMAEARGRLTAR
jgi:tetratricopeptide (TPR) repeat protein